MTTAPPARSRNAAATKAALLEAARLRFGEEGYEGAALRDIAADVGVDVALVARYFGSKEQLFRDVLTSKCPPDEVLQGDRDGFGERVARLLVVDPPDDSKLGYLLMMLRSINSPKAAECIRQNGRENFFGPLEELMGGKTGGARARIVAGLLTGLAIMRAMDEDYVLDPAQLEEMRERLARVLQDLADDHGGTGDG